MADTSDIVAADLQRANDLMVEALVLLDAHQSLAAAHLDLAIVRLGIRSDADGMPAAFLTNRKDVDQIGA